MEICAMLKDKAKNRMREIGDYLLKLKEQEKKKKKTRFVEMQDLVDSSSDDESVHAIEKRIPGKSRKRKIIDPEFSPEELEFQRKCGAMNSSSDEDSK